MLRLTVGPVFVLFDREHTDSGVGLTPLFSPPLFPPRVRAAARSLSCDLPVPLDIGDKSLPPESGTSALWGLEPVQARLHGVCYSRGKLSTFWLNLIYLNSTLRLCV